MDRNITIGRLAKAAGVGVETIRYYQRRGLVATPRRATRAFRDYENDDVSRAKSPYFERKYLMRAAIASSKATRTSSQISPMPLIQPIPSMPFIMRVPSNAKRCRLV